MFIRGKKLNIYLVFMTQSYFKVGKDVRLNTTNFLFQKPQIGEIFKKLRKIFISTNYFTNIYGIYTIEPYSFFVNDTTLASDNP